MNANATSAKMVPTTSGSMCPGYHKNGQTGGQAAHLERTCVEFHEAVTELQTRKSCEVVGTETHGLALVVKARNRRNMWLACRHDLAAAIGFASSLWQFISEQLMGGFR